MFNAFQKVCSLYLALPKNHWVCLELSTSYRYISLAVILPWLSRLSFHKCVNYPIHSTDCARPDLDIKALIKLLFYRYANRKVGLEPTAFQVARWFTHLPYNSGNRVKTLVQHQYIRYIYIHTKNVVRKISPLIWSTEFFCFHKRLSCICTPNVERRINDVIISSCSANEVIQVSSLSSRMYLRDPPFEFSILC
jgi:hypothetical protein